MQDTITLEIETNGQITSHELPVEERDGRKVVRLVVVAKTVGRGEQVYASGPGYAAAGGGGAKGGGGGQVEVSGGWNASDGGAAGGDRGYDTVTIWSGLHDMIYGAGSKVFGPYTVPSGSGTVYVKMSSRDLDKGGGKGG